MFTKNCTKAKNARMNWVGIETKKYAIIKLYFLIYWKHNLYCFAIQKFHFEKFSLPRFINHPSRTIREPGFGRGPLAVGVLITKFLIYTSIILDTSISSFHKLIKRSSRKFNKLLFRCKQLFGTNDGGS